MIALFKSVDVRFPRGLARYIIVVFVQFQYEENEAADFRGFSRATKEIKWLISEIPRALHAFIVVTAVLIRRK